MRVGVGLGVGCWAITASGETHNNKSAANSEIRSSKSHKTTLTIFRVSSCPLVDRILLRCDDRIFPAATEQDGWDGHFRGREALPGVYIYIAEVIYIDGRKERIKGELTLVR